LDSNESTIKRAWIFKKEGGNSFAILGRNTWPAIFDISSSLPDAKRGDLFEQNRFFFATSQHLSSGITDAVSGSYR